jgi:hypothetical protein
MQPLGTLILVAAVALSLMNYKLSPEDQHLANLATGGNLPYATLP